MVRVIFDTDVYISWINEKGYTDIIFKTVWVKYLSAVVIMELYAGALKKNDQRLVQRLYEAHARANRVVLPSTQDYIDAGNILMKLQKLKGYDRRKTYSLSNDVLIALSARSIGAVLITNNVQDFQAIRKITGFKLQTIR